MFKCLFINVNEFKGNYFYELDVSLSAFECMF